jgi:hypothetical protein
MGGSQELAKEEVRESWNFKNVGCGIQNPTTTANVTTKLQPSAPGLLERVWLSWLLPVRGEL